MHPRGLVVESPAREKPLKLFIYNNLSGAPGGTRTPDLRLRSLAVSLRPLRYPAVAEDRGNYPRRFSPVAPPGLIKAPWSATGPAPLMHPQVPPGVPLCRVGPTFEGLSWAWRRRDQLDELVPTVVTSRPEPDASKEMLASDVTHHPRLAIPFAQLGDHVALGSGQPRCGCWYGRRGAVHPLAQSRLRQVQVAGQPRHSLTLVHNQVGLGLKAVMEAAAGAPRRGLGDCVQWHPPLRWCPRPEGPRRREPALDEIGRPHLGPARLRGHGPGAPACCPAQPQRGVRRQLDLPGVLLSSRSAAINRSTMHRATTWPSRLNWRHTLRRPYTR